MVCPECGSPRLEQSVLGEAFAACQACGKLSLRELPLVEQAEPLVGTEVDNAYDPDIPVYSEVSIGWRAWRVPVAEGWELPKLQSVTHTEAIWLPRQVCEAKCPFVERRATSRRKKALDPSNHHVPMETCTCGLYAAISLEQLKRLRYNYYDEEANRGHYRVIGSVSLWGKVIPGTQGWKAQYGYPRELFVPYEAWKIVEPLRDLYGVPVSLDNLLR